MKNKQLILGLGITSIIIAAALARLSDTIPNFAPIGALALFSGAIFTDKRWSFFLPLGAILLSDIILEIVQKGGGFYPGITFNYASYFLIVLIGIAIRKRLSVVNVTLGSLSASVLFFLVSNLGVWISGSLSYAYSWTGIIDCFTMAQPFFRYTLISDLLFSGVCFSIYYFVTHRRLFFTA